MDSSSGGSRLARKPYKFVNFMTSDPPKYIYFLRNEPKQILLVNSLVFEIL